MTFRDLPADWDERPLTDPRLVADTLDLLVMERDRVSGCLLLLQCDDDGRLVQPVVLTDPPDRAPEAECGAVIAGFLRATGRWGSLLLAVGRRDGLSITTQDQAWARAMGTVCGDDVRSLGAYVVTLDGSREIPSADLAA
jgi:hypothetical protein